MADGYDVVCACCGKRRGSHSTRDEGILCPDEYGVFHEGVGWPQFYVGYGMSASKANEKSIGPRKPVPALPVEVFHTKEFNAEEAWAAIVALSKGS